jgi:uncharacterized cupin superfamily protein
MADYTILKLAEAEDRSGDYPGEIKALKNPLEAQQVAITYRRMAPGSGSIRGSRRGHRHKTQEEVIVVLTGKITLRLEGEEFAVGPWQAVRIAPQVAQDLWNHGPAEAELLIISTRIENLMDDLELIDGYWDQPPGKTPDYTLVDIAEIEDVLGDYPGEMKLLKDPLHATQVAVSFRRMPKGTGSKGYYGHRHHNQEEIIFVRTGTLQVKLNDEVKDIGPNQLVRISPGVVQGAYNNQDEDVELLIISNRLPEEDQVDKVENFWPAD